MCVVRGGVLGNALWSLGAAEEEIKVASSIISAASQCFISALLKKTKKNTHTRLFLYLESPASLCGF